MFVGYFCSSKRSSKQAGMAELELLFTFNYVRPQTVDLASVPRQH